MATTVFDVLKEKYLDDITARESSLAAGSAKDFAEYSHQCGTVRGLRIALAHVEDLARAYMEDDDD